MSLFSRRFIRLVTFLLLLVYITNINAFKPHNDDEEYIDIGVRLTGDVRDQLIADLIAQERGVLSSGHIEGVGLYHFQIRHKRNARSKRAAASLVEELKRDERIEYVTVGEQLERKKRDLFSDDRLIDLYNKYKQKKQYNDDDDDESIEIDRSILDVSFDDKYFPEQWYLQNKGQLNTPENHDINVVPAWSAGYSGRGVLISIVDDGLDHAHQELRDRYQARFSYDLNDLNDTEHDPSPNMDVAGNNHGTECAGAAVAKANNEICGAGVAFNSDISGIRILDGPITTLLEARALTLFANDTDIKSASWGPTDDGTKMEAPRDLTNAALDYGVTHGRSGRGLLYIWASGNGGASDDDCGADGYVSHHNVISIGSINHMGKSTYFSEFCPSTMAVAYTGGRHSRTSYEDTIPVGVITSDIQGGCTKNFAGTSSAAPIAAGVYALVLEANPQLGYRDLMHITARTARIPNLDETDDWIINGAGYHVSDKFGFGVLDAGQMVALAQNWTNVLPRYECIFNYTGDNVKLNIDDTIEIPIDVENCINITHMEHVVARVSYDFHRRGDVKLTLTSPSKTPSEVLSYRSNDASHKGIRNFPFLTNHNWDEHPVGRWTLRVETRKPQTSESEQSAMLYRDIGALNHFSLRIFGSHQRENKKEDQHAKRKNAFAYVPTQDEIESMYEREFAVRKSPNVMLKRNYHKLSEEQEIEKRTSMQSSMDQSIWGKIRGVIKDVFNVSKYIALGLEIYHKVMEYLHKIMGYVHQFLPEKSKT
ncbi:unnamed protein product [Adineta steineri]|uniref:P/Homo B domain-containing protein n=1 Tax=Adineta steineri TaxID=433720 RepID=A0A818PFH3_9BILA|nr:unnamed protein product [Adineta steineri]CAF3620286.1 unnamed protein product [Adineta steineri]